MEEFYFFLILTFYSVGMQIFYLIGSFLFGIHTKLTSKTRLRKFILYSIIALITCASIQAIIVQTISGFPDGKPRSLTPQLWESNFISYLLPSLIFLLLGILFFYIGIFVKSLISGAKVSR